MHRSSIEDTKRNKSETPHLRARKISVFRLLIAKYVITARGGEKQTCPATI